MIRYRGRSQLVKKTVIKKIVAAGTPMADDAGFVYITTDLVKKAMTVPTVWTAQASMGDIAKFFVVC